MATLSAYVLGAGTLDHEPRNRHRQCLLSALCWRLECPATVEVTIRQTRYSLSAAEVEIVVERITNGPATHMHGERRDLAALIERDEQFLCWRQLCVLCEQCPECRIAQAWKSRFQQSARRFFSRTRLVRSCLGRCSSSRQAKSVHFPDDGVARNFAKFARDSARAEPIRPQLLQQIDSFIRPSHVYLPLCKDSSGGSWGAAAMIVALFQVETMSA